MAAQAVTAPEGLPACSPCSTILYFMLAALPDASTSSAEAIHRSLSLREPLAADSIPSNPIDIAVI